MWVCFWFHQSISLFLHQYLALITVALQQFLIWSAGPLIFHLRVSCYSSPLISYVSHEKSHIWSHNPVFKFSPYTLVGILIRIALSLWSILGKLSIFIILDHSIYKHCTFFIYLGIL